MADYKPSSIVVSLCKKLNAVPLAEAIRLDGTVVIVVADGRKLTFGKDDITRTLAGPDPESPKTVVVDQLDGAQADRLAKREAQKAERKAKKAARAQAKGVQ